MKPRAGNLAFLCSFESIHASSPRWLLPGCFLMPLDLQTPLKKRYPLRRIRVGISIHPELAILVDRSVEHLGSDSVSSFFRAAVTDYIARHDGLPDEIKAELAAVGVDRDRRYPAAA
jgi:hypothetical protein